MLRKFWDIFRKKAGQYQAAVSEKDINILERLNEQGRTEQGTQKQKDNIKSEITTEERRNSYKTIQGDLPGGDNLLHTLMNTLQVQISIKDTKSRFLLCNEACAKHFGVESPDEVIGKTDFDFFPDALAAQLYEEEQNIISTGEPIIQKYMCSVDKAGHTKWGLVTKVPLRGSDGKITGILGIGQNMTRLKQTEEALEKERNLLRTIVNTLPDQIFAKDINSTFVFGNLATSHNLGLKATEEMTGKTDFDFFVKQQADKYYKEEQDIIRTGKPMINKEVCIKKEDGQIKWISSTKVPWRDNNRKIIGIVGMNRNITATKEMEAKLRQERNLLLLLIDQLPNNVFIKDLDSRFVVCNKSVADFFCTTTENVIGKTDFDFLPRDRAAKLYAEEQQIIRSGKPIINKNVEGVDMAGNRIWALHTKLPINGSDGKITGIMGICINITELKNTEKEIKKLRNLFSTFIDIIPDNVYVKDANGIYLFANDKAAYELCGAGAQKIIGKRDIDFLSIEQTKKRSKEEQQVIRTGKSIINQKTCYYITGHAKEYLITKIPLCDDSGNVIGVICIDRKITEQATGDKKKK